LGCNSIFFRQWHRRSLILALAGGELYGFLVGGATGGDVARLRRSGSWLLCTQGLRPGLTCFAPPALGFLWGAPSRKRRVGGAGFQFVAVRGCKSGGKPPHSKLGAGVQAQGLWGHGARRAAHLRRSRLWLFCTQGLRPGLTCFAPPALVRGMLCSSGVGERCAARLISAGSAPEVSPAREGWERWQMKFGAP